jgi:hypothetical protein
MRQKKKILHPKIITVRPSAKCGHFVSYSGRGFRQQKRKYIRITKAGKLISSNKDRWTAFYRNGRPKFLKNCIILCDVVFDSTNMVEQFWEASYSHLPSQHAEVKVLQFIKARELRFWSRTRWGSWLLWERRSLCLWWAWCPLTTVKIFCCIANQKYRYFYIKV